MTHRTAERRTRPRLRLHAAVQVQQEGAEAIEDGVLDDISLDGFRLWSEQTFAVDTRLCLLIDTDKAETGSLRIPATVLRTHLEKRGRRFGYGCRIDGIINPRRWFDLVYELRRSRKAVRVSLDVEPGDRSE